MNRAFQLILLFSSILFFIFILNMVRNKNLELKHALIWLFTSLTFILLSIFPIIITKIALLLHIVEPANSLFLLVLFFLLIIIFTLTVTLSKSVNKINTLVQEIGLIKLSIEKLYNKNRGEQN